MSCRVRALGRFVRVFVFGLLFDFFCCVAWFLYTCGAHCLGFLRFCRLRRFDSRLLGFFLFLRRYGSRLRFLFRGFGRRVALFEFEQFSLISLHERDYIFVVHNMPPLGKICRASVLRARKDIPYPIYCRRALLVTRPSSHAYLLARRRKIL